ncbi:carbon storage regulator [Stieleria sp. TO1_6]|uniref:carbon storage regulator n=1 Tax=Stieleria tagensis TaxID=2956795 RepID=UPI00209AEF95|nr:carbon storage regulator [Stieleria tagensis]MCO8122678.1 carbon storage regulator [Stieleria tagensis]
MLVLSRKIGEKLMIGDEVCITINRISGNRVAIGIEAPRDVKITRGELNQTQVSRSAPAPNTASMGDPTVAVASKADA